MNHRKPDQNKLKEDSNRNQGKNTEPHSEPNLDAETKAIVEKLKTCDYI